MGCVPVMPNIQYATLFLRSLIIVRASAWNVAGRDMSACEFGVAWVAYWRARRVLSGRGLLAGVRQVKSRCTVQ